MKQFGLCLILFYAPAIAAATQVTASNVNAISQRPILVVTSLGCDAGQMHVTSVERSLKDLEGVRIAWADGNDTHKIFKNPPNFAFGSVLLVKDGAILETSTEYNEKTGHANISSSDVRQWAYSALTKHGISFKMQKPHEIFSAPYSDNAPANLEDGLKMHYPLRSDLKDATGQHGDFETGTKNSIPNGAYYMAGEYGYPPNSGKFYNDGYAILRNLGKLPAFAETGGGLSVNIKPEKNPRKDNLLFTLGERRFEYWISEKTGQLFLITHAACGRCGPGGKGTSHEDSYYFPGVTMDFGKWYNFVVSIDLAKGRIMTLLNGRRLPDAMLSPQFIELNRQVDFSPSIAFRLLQGGWGAPARGYTRDVVLYNRALNSSEMTALAARYGDQSAPVAPPQDPTEKEQANKAFLQAVTNGDLAAAKKHLDAGAQINFIYQDWSALNLAAYFGREDLVRLLVSQHADVLHEVRPGINSQELARSKGHSRIVKILEDASNTPRFFGERKIGNHLHRSMVPDVPVVQ